MPGRDRPRARPARGRRNVDGRPARNAPAGVDLLLVLDNFEQLTGIAPEVAETVAAAPGLTVLVDEPDRAPRLGRACGSGRPARLPQCRRAVHAPVPRPPERRLRKTSSRRPGRSASCWTACLSQSSSQLPGSGACPSDELLRRLEDRLGLLIAGPHDLPERQRTMRATIDWSYDLLSPSAQQALAQLSVFVGRLHARGRGGRLSRRRVDRAPEGHPRSESRRAGGSRYRLLEVVGSTRQNGSETTSRCGAGTRRISFRSPKPPSKD